MESIEESLKSVCRRVKKALRLLHATDTARPADGGLNESGFKALFQGALADDTWHVESEFHLGGQYADLMLTRRDAPFDVAVVLDLKYCATPFIASKAYTNASNDPKQLEALKRLSVLDICKLRMFWSKGYEAVSVKTVLVAAKKQTNAFAESLLATGMFPFVLSVAVVGIGPCLVTKIETLGRVRPLLVPAPQTLFPRAHADLQRLQHRVRAGMASMRSTDGDVDAAAGFKSGITLTGLKMLFLGALHDSSFFVGSAVNMATEDRRSRVHRAYRSRSSSRSRSRSNSSSRSRSYSSSDSSRSRSRSSSPRHRSSHKHHSSGKKKHTRSHHHRGRSPESRSRSRSHSRSRSRSLSGSRSSRSPSPRSRERDHASRMSLTSITGRDGVTYNVRNEQLGVIHLLLFDERSAPTRATVVHFKYFPINDVHEWNAQLGAFERFGDQRFEQDKLRHKRRLYFSEGLRRMSGLTREELERVYVSNPAAAHASSSASASASAAGGGGGGGGAHKVDTVGSIARAYTSLAFRQSQAVLEKFPTLTACTSVSIIGVGSTLLWLQEEVSPTPPLLAGMGELKAQLASVERADELRELARKHPRRKGQTEREWDDMIRDMQRKREQKRYQALQDQQHHGHHHRDSRARSTERRSSGHTNGLLASGKQSDIIALLAERYEQRQHSQGRSRSAARGRSRD